MKDFFSSDAGQCASIAKQYLEGALTLCTAQRAKGRILFLPTLALAGHGLELMLKACFYLNGQTPHTSGPKGHDIVGLWRADLCEPVRGHLFYNAHLVAAEARAGGVYPDIPDNDDILPLIEDYVVALGELHGGKRYPLRYPSDQSRKAPRSPFLVRTLWVTADDFVKRPSEFELFRFRGKV